MTTAGVIDADYRGEVEVVLANLGDQPYRVEKANRITQPSIQKVDTLELHEVVQVEDTQRRNQGFRSPASPIDQRVQGQSVQPQMEINEISARAFTQFYQRGEMTGIPRWVEINNEIELEAINISLE